jgi:hypothetical protein
LGYRLIRALALSKVVGEIVEKLVLMLIIGVHEAVGFVHHVLLAPSRVLKHAITEEAKIAEMNPLCYVAQQAF